MKVMRLFISVGEVEENNSATNQHRYIAGEAMHHPNGPYKVDIPSYPLASPFEFLMKLGPFTLQK